MNGRQSNGMSQDWQAVLQHHPLTHTRSKNYLTEGFGAFSSCLNHSPTIFPHCGFSVCTTPLSRKNLTTNDCLLQLNPLAI